MTVARAAIVDHMAERDADDHKDGVPTWITRTVNFSIAVSQIKGSATFVTTEETDEHLVLAAPGMSLTATTGDGQEACTSGQALFLIPVGSATVVVEGSGPVLRVFTHRAKRVASQRPSDPDVIPLSDSMGVEQFLRVVRLEHLREGPQFGRIFMSRHLMINVFDIKHQRRDTRKLTPHSHADFEQASITLAGDFLHHLRYPWGPDLADWRDDQHVAVGSPSATIIPPHVIHTTRDVGEGATWLIDVFAPPRHDFIKNGWVRDFDQESLA